MTAAGVAARALIVVAALAVAAPARAAAAGARTVIDDFEDLSAWSAHPASGVALAIRSDAGVHGRALRLDFRFTGGGYAVARRAVALDLPANYRLRFAVRGKCLPNDLELKLIDASGENVWWMNRRGFVFPERWDTLVTRKRQITFAWGPQGGGEIREVAAIEIAVTAGQGGTGSVWLDDFTLEPLPAESAAPPALRTRASSGAAEAAFDGDTATAWRPSPSDLRPWLEVDLVHEREFGGLELRWAAGRHASDYAIELSSDGRAWRVAREVRRGNGGADFLALPESEARLVRLRPRAGGREIALASLEVQPLAWTASPESFYEAIARAAPRGLYPRAIAGAPVAWTLVGRDADREEGLLGQDGALESGKARFSIEPFVWTDGRLVTWADAAITRRLEEPGLPIPTVAWRAGDLELEITALGAGERERPELWARYRLVNRGARAARATLHLALRPFQVNPPVQFLNTPGGTAKVGSIARAGRIVRVNGDRGLTSLTMPDGFGAATFDEGDVVADWLRHGALPRAASVVDPTERAAAALSYDAHLAPGGERIVVIVVPLEGRPTFDLDVRSDADANQQFQWRLQRALRDGRDALDRVELHLASRDLERTVNAQLGWILLNRDGPAIQPGSRSYERSWIRDGALTSSALLRLGHPEVVREFVTWFAKHQYPDGKVPCCVDRRGADPVPEHDSHGELIYLIAEYYRYTGNRATVEALWPHVLGAARYLDTLRSERLGPEWEKPEKREFRGILPPSISHEGYSAKPMHSYWDDFFALRGYKDAAWLAGELGRADDRARLAASRDAFSRDLAASIRAAMARHKIDYVPGCADLGDFDATSTTIALAPGSAEAILPPGALERTFERYWQFFRDRRDGKTPWEAYTPYEVRTIGSFVRLGWRDRANELLEYFMGHRSPPEWAQWAEVVWNDSLKPRFVGDLPHTWVGSDFVRSVLDMVAYERESDSTLVLGAGIPTGWVFGGEGVQVGRLPTRYGQLGFRMHADGAALAVRIEPGVRVPRGGIVVSPPPPPGRKAWRRATLDGAPLKIAPNGEVVVRRTGVNLEFR